MIPSLNVFSASTDAQSIINETRFSSQMENHFSKVEKTNKIEADVLYSKLFNRMSI